jgi:hypothetical protein
MLAVCARALVELRRSVEQRRDLRGRIEVGRWGRSALSFRRLPLAGFAGMWPYSTATSRICASSPIVRLIVELDSGRRSILSDPTQDAVDRFGRSLFYVDGTDGVDVGEEMLRASWANVFVFDQDFQRLSRYRAARTEARDADAGVWGLCDGDFHRTRADELRERRLAAVAFMRRYYTRVTNHQFATARGMLARPLRRKLGPFSSCGRFCSARRSNSSCRTAGRQGCTACF